MPHAARVESGITAWFYFCLTPLFINPHEIVSLSHTHTHTHTLKSVYDKSRSAELF